MCSHKDPYKRKANGDLTTEGRRLCDHEKGQERGDESQSTIGHHKLAKARKQILPWSVQRKQTCPHHSLDFRCPELEENKFCCFQPLHAW